MWLDVSAARSMQIGRISPMRTKKPSTKPVITLTTDFGLQDGFVGTMKGVIWRICPQAHIADISHAISPQNVMEAAFVLWRAYSFFPAGTVHVAVVDPGVGTGRRSLAMRIGEWAFVGPDNGLFTLVLEDAEKNGWPVEIVMLTKPEYWLPAVSRTFHGRDIFAPVGAHLARGVSLAALGSSIADLQRLPVPKPEKTPDGWRVHILGQDSFGNLTTDLPVELLNAPGHALLRVGGLQVRGLAQAYADRPSGELIALADSSGRLEIAAVDGSAAILTGARAGDIVEVVE